MTNAAGDLPESSRQVSLGAPTLTELPPGAVRPAGWLLEQLRLQADGLTGHLEELWPDVGPNNAWRGGAGDDWERGPYYLDGLIPLAYALDDENLKAKATVWVEAILASQREDGQFGPRSNEDWWPRMVALKALTQHADATGDSRVPPFLERYFRYQLEHLPGRPLYSWGQVRGADNVLSVFWLYERTGEAWPLELVDLLASQNADWEGFLTERMEPGAYRTWSHLVHGPNVAMGLKAPAMAFLRDGDAVHLERTDRALENLDAMHGLVHGIFTGDEWLAGQDPTHGAETCEVVELMFSLEHLVRVFGQARFADRLETIAYNALAAACSADMRTHQYHQQANQVLVSLARRDWTMSGDDANLFGFEPFFGCCTANLHQGWPKLTRSLWMTTPDGGLAATAYAPCSVTLRTRSGGLVTLSEETDYPFDEVLTFRVAAQKPERFPLELRVPGWCLAPALTVNDEPVGAQANERGYVRLEREWRDGDCVRLTLPMEVRALQRPRGAVGLALGPLVLAYSPGEVWERLPDSPGFGDFEVRPRRTWNFGLAVDPADPASACRVERLGPTSPPFGIKPGPTPFGAAGVPVRVHVPARQVPGWGMERNSAAPPPESPVPESATTDWTNVIPLVPFGCARLRIAEFPRIPAGLGKRSPA